VEGERKDGALRKHQIQKSFIMRLFCKTFAAAAACLQKATRRSRKNVSMVEINVIYAFTFAMLMPFFRYHC